MIENKSPEREMGEMSANIKAIRRELSEMRSEQKELGSKYVTKEEFKPYKAVLVAIGSLALASLFDSIVSRLNDQQQPQIIYVKDKKNE